MATGTSHRTPGTLPPQSSAFVGRETELARARELLPQARLATITAWLFGAAAPLWERAGRPYTGSPTHTAPHQAAVRTARGGLGDDRFRELHAAGAAAPLDRVIERALFDDDQLDWPGEGS